MQEKGRLRLQWPIYRSIVEESFPSPSIYDAAYQIRQLSELGEACIADWIDSEFGTSEQTILDVPAHGSDQSSESDLVEEVKHFNAQELSPGHSRKLRSQKHRQLPHSVLIRAMYLALARLRAAPTGPIVLLDDMCSPRAIGIPAPTEVRTLRVQVRRRLICFETPVIAEGEVTVRRADTSANDRASLSPRPPHRQTGQEHNPD